MLAINTKAFYELKIEENKIKKLLTSAADYDNISELLKTTENIDN